MNIRMVYIIAAIIALVPFGYLFFLYPQLPETVPTHFGMNGEPDDYSSRNSLFISVGVMTLIGVGTFLLLMNLHKIEPKKHKNSPAVMAKIALAILLLVSLIQLMIVDSAQTGNIRFDKILLPLMGLFFAFLGNLFYSIKPNYFVGIRTPWALEDENNWRLTHRLAGKIWFIGGILSMFITLVLPFKIAVLVFIAFGMVMGIIPIVYSYKIFKRKKAVNK